MFNCSDNFSSLLCGLASYVPPPSRPYKLNKTWREGMCPGAAPSRAIRWLRQKIRIFEPQPKSLVTAAMSPSGSPGSFPFKDTCAVLAGKNEERSQELILHLRRGESWQSSRPGFWRDHGEARWSRRLWLCCTPCSSAVGLSNFTPCNSSLRNAVDSGDTTAPTFSPWHQASFQRGNCQGRECDFPPAVCCRGSSAFWVS